MTPPPAHPPEGESWLPESTPAVEGWSRKKFLFILALVLAGHVGLIFLLGTKKQVAPRVVANVPHLQLAESADEIITLGDPTLFARPNAHDVVTAFWRSPLAVTQPNFNWTEDPKYLAPALENFGALLREFIQRSQLAEFPLNFKPEPDLTIPVVTADDTPPGKTTMQIGGDLAGRRLLTSIGLPALPRNDIIAPSKVQALVDAAGNVFSAIVLQANPDTDADQQALQLTRSLRFAAAAGSTLGEITFTWHTVPTNAVSATPP